MRFISSSSILILLLFLLSKLSIAQPVREEHSVNETFRIARELFQEEKYISALDRFEKLQEESDEFSSMYMEAAFYIAVCYLETGNVKGKWYLEQFLDKYHQSPHHSVARLKLSNLEFEQGKYKDALAGYKEIELYRLTDLQKDECKFKSAYCYLEEGNNSEARSLFYDLKNNKGIYSESAMYYWAHINYLEGNYETALIEFRKLENSEEFSGIIPFYKAQINYLQNNFEKVIEMAPPLLNSSSEQRKTDISGIIGNSFFMLEKYNEAIPYLEEFHRGKESLKYSDYYTLGYCYYKNSQYSEAIKYLEKAIKGDGQMVQNAYYHLADAYLKTGDQQKAMMAFRSASEMEFDEDITEDALFQYAKITYELQFSPFNEAIKAFDKYISRYPDSERNDAAYDYLVKVFMTTRNYKDALASLDKITVKSSSIKKAYQKVSYSRGLELFKNLEFEGAIDMFNKSLQYSESDSRIKALSYYWKAEAFYRLGDMKSALRDYGGFRSVPGAFSLKEYAVSYYSTGYAWFEQDNYESAQRWFGKFLNATPERNSQLVADASNRLGDCFYIQRNFSKAVSYYTRAYETGKYDSDYALFQIAFCHGRMRDQHQKINGMNKLQATYPESQYIDDALFETGRAWENLHNTDNASKSYLSLIERFPMSPHLPKAYLQLGLINYNRNNYSKSLDYYKHVVENYSNSDEAKAALNGIRNNYVEMNKVEEYFSYTRGLGNFSTPSETEHDSLLFISAEKLYMARDPEAKDELSKYVSKFPDGKFTLNAHFYKAECHMKDNEFPEAAADYDFVLEQADNIFTETSLLKASGLAYDLKDFSKALSLYERLETFSNTSKNKLTALTGKMRCNYELERFEEVTKTAYMLRNEEKIPEELIREASYKSAKSYQSLNQNAKALPLWRKISSETSTPEGAEGKFRVCEYYYNSEQYKEAENEVMDFIDKNTPYQYWLAKSFILLANVYRIQGDLFQATHTLKSIIENYDEPEDGIIEESEKLLRELESVGDLNAESTDSVTGSKETSNPSINN